MKVVFLFFFNDLCQPCVFLLRSTGHTGRYIKALFSTSLIFLLAHVSFQICLYTIPSLDDALGHNCSSWETLSRHVGVSRLPLEDPWSMVWLLTPDLGIFIISLITLILCSRLLKKREEGPIPHMSSLLQEVS
ncbi:Piezo-type mechanosensitive ion channel component 1 [Labeo rohita]|uniref:Piezo-type mechanosensitive ion channel component 1 n=1 Tax=Labeo rohita TaxID=84645 RepID=A0ABQ8MIY5_LABRO|nr:Piezo-type mechanosensitive ion channel component 1 [Labeo rohita]